MAKPVGRPPTLRVPYPNNLAELRTAAGRTQQEIADEIGIQVAGWSKIERGHHRIPPERFVAICKALRCSPLDINALVEAMPADERTALQMFRSLSAQGRATWVELGRTLRNSNPANGTPARRSRRRR